MKGRRKIVETNACLIGPSCKHIASRAGNKNMFIVCSEGYIHIIIFYIST